MAERNAEERRTILEGLQQWSGTRSAYAKKAGISKATLGRWLQENPQYRERKGTEPVPTFVEVLSPAATQPLRMMLPGNLQIAFETLPSPAWVASLARELARC